MQAQRSNTRANGVGEVSLGLRNLQRVYTGIFEKAADNVKSAGSAGKSKGVLRFDFWISCWQRKIYLRGATKLLGPALDELAPADCTVTWSFTDHHFSGPDMRVLHPSPAGGCNTLYSAGVGRPSPSRLGLAP